MISIFFDDKSILEDIEQKYHFLINLLNKKPSQLGRVYVSPKIRKRNSVYQVKCLEELIKKSITKCEGFEFTNNILSQFEKSEIIVLSTLWTEDDLLALNNLIPLIHSKNKKIVK